MVNGEALTFLIVSPPFRIWKWAPVLVTTDVNATLSPGSACVLSGTSVIVSCATMSGALGKLSLIASTGQLGVPGEQVPARHASPVVHELPSSHADPLAFAGLEQAPVAGSHVPALWH